MNRLTKGQGLFGKPKPEITHDNKVSVASGDNILTIDQLKSNILLVTGSPTGAVGLVFNSAYINAYTVLNQTAQTVTGKNTSGATVEITTGLASQLMNDGTNIIKCT